MCGSVVAECVWRCEDRKWVVQWLTAGVWCSSAGYSAVVTFGSAVMADGTVLVTGGSAVETDGSAVVITYGITLCQPATDPAITGARARTAADSIYARHLLSSIKILSLWSNN